MSIKKIAQEIISKNPVILDTETTGLGYYCEIVSIGIVDIDGNILLDTLVKPTVGIPTEATKIHGLTNDDVANSPSYLKLMPKIESILKDRTVCIYNAEYDIRLMQQSALAHDVKPFNLSEVHCVMEMYAEFWGDWNEYRQSYKWQKLANAVAQCGLEPSGKLHHAVNDAEMTRQVLLHMAK